MDNLIGIDGVRAIAGIVRQNLLFIDGSISSGEMLESNLATLRQLDRLTHGDSEIHGQIVKMIMFATLLQGKEN